MTDFPFEYQPQDIPYTQIHDDVLADARLSYKARGILAYLLSRAGKWEVRFKDILNHSDHDGRVAIQAGMAELVEYGYVALSPVYKSDGTLAGKRYVILKHPNVPKDILTEKQVSCSSGNTTLGKHDPRETCLITRSEEVRTNSKKEELNQKIKIEDHPPTPLPENAQLSLAADPPFGEEVAKGGGSYRATAPGGETSLPTPTNNSHPKARRKPAEKKPMTSEAATVLAHLNRVAERDYRIPGKIQARLNDGATVEECLLVIDYVNATYSGEFREKYLNYDSPFRPENFDKNRANAVAWRAKNARRDSSILTQDRQPSSNDQGHAITFIKQHMSNLRGAQQ